MSSVLVSEFVEAVEKVHDRFFTEYKRLQRQHQQQPFLIAEGNSRSTDANGLLDFPVYVNSTGKHLEIGRVLINCDGFTPAAGFSAGSCYGYLYTGTNGGGGSDPAWGMIFDMFPSSPGGQVFPNVAEYSGHNALRLKENETLSFFLRNGPVSKNVTVTFFGYLEPTDTEYV